MLKKLILAILSTISIIALTGCATIVSGTQQKVELNTGNVSGAVCSLENNKGSWYVPSTPAVATIGRSYHDLKVNCTKKGYKPTVVQVSSNTKGIVFGNALLGGVVGAGVDIANGAAYSYPDNISVPMYKA